jgi:predicted phage tail protein
MLRTVHLHGALRKRYGKSFELDVASAQEAAQALGYMVPGFQRDIVDGTFRVIVGPKKTGYHLGPEEVRLNLGKAETIHVVPVVRGSKRSGVGKIILGIALIGLAFVPGVNMVVAGVATSAATAMGATATAASLFGSTLLFKAGAMLALGGVAQALAGTPKMNYGSIDRDRQQSFIFNGPVNTSAQGGVVPVVIGRMMVGSIVISGGISPEQIEVT